MWFNNFDWDISGLFASLSFAIGVMKQGENKVSNQLLCVLQRLICKLIGVQCRMAELRQWQGICSKFSRSSVCSVHWIESNVSINADCNVDAKVSEESSKKRPVNIYRPLIKVGMKL